MRQKPLYQISKDSSKNLLIGDDDARMPRHQ